MTVHVDIQYKTENKNRENRVTKQNEAVSGENLSTLKHLKKPKIKLHSSQTRTNR